MKPDLEGKTKFTTREVRGITYDFYVDSQGRFSVVFDDEEIQHKDLQALYERLVVVSRPPAGKVSLPFVEYNSGVYGHRGLRFGTITGIHGANNNLLATFEDGSREQLHGEKFLRLDSEAKIAEFTHLEAAKNAASKEFDQYVAAHTFDARKEVEAKLREEKP